MRREEGEREERLTQQGWNEQESAAVMVSEAENVIMAWHLALLVLASMLCCLFAATMC